LSSRRWRWRWGALGLLLIGLAAPAQAQPVARAAGGRQLVEAMESAPATAVVEVTSLRQLDEHGFAGRMRVETALSGAVRPGSALDVAWEELSPLRAPRFAPGERVLLALEPLGGESIWVRRIPEAELRARTLTPARRGDAFLRRPSLPEVDLLAHYLALAPAARAGPPGAAYLAQLAARAQPPLALSALERLAQLPALDASLGASGGEELVAALLRPDAGPEQREALLALVEARGLESLRAPLAARAAVRDPLPSPLVFAALARLDGGLAADGTERLLSAAATPEHRRVAARWAGGADAAERLNGLARRDPDPEVRSYALVRLVELEREAAIPAAARGLADAEQSVRLAAARSLGALGAPAVPELRQVAERGTAEAAQAAVMGLMLTSSAEGNEALAALAGEHPDAAIRDLARLALGGELGHRH